MISTTIACDMCGINKGVTNQWFVGMDDSHDGDHAITVMPLRNPESVNKAAHLCGSTCALRFVSAWLGRQ